MNAHMKSAVEAGVKALPGIPAHDEETRLMQNTAQAVVNAALPDLRAMFAAEIKSEIDRINRTFDGNSFMHSYHPGLDRAMHLIMGTLRVTPHVTTVTINDRGVSATCNACRWTTRWSKDDGSVQEAATRHEAGSVR